uniref:Immediate early response 2 n=1 Tax=Pseudonaja textilis TaxID=8673 RepID=A0A670YHG0_PSETE
MEVQKEAQRIMTMSVWKMYHSRMQRGGLRLHRSLQLSLVMRNARDLYLSANPQHLEGPPAILFPSAQQEAPPPTPQPCGSLDPEPMETQEEPGSSLPAHSLTQMAWSRGASGPLLVSRKPSRKRRSSSLGKIGAAEAGLVPSKKAKLAEEEGERQPQRQEGPFPSLARILQDRFSSLILQPPPAKGAEEPKANCRQGDGVLSITVRAVVAF